MFLSSKYKLPNYFHGGKQELERRAGTVNVSGVAGLAAALKEQQETLSEEKILLEGGIGGLGNVHFKTSTKQAPQ